MKWTATLAPFVVGAVAVVILAAPAVAGAADVQGTLVRVDPVAKVIMLDDGRTLTMTDRTMILVNGQPIAATRVIPGTLVLVRDAEPAARASDALTMTVQAPQPTATVQIPQTKVIVQQPAPRIVVNQMPPQVVVAPAPAPQVSLSGGSGIEGPATGMQQTRVTSTPDDLTMTVQAPQPTATVQIPQTTVIVQQPAPRIVVNQMPPHVVVAPAPAPHVVVERRAAAAPDPAASPALRVTPSVAASRTPARAVTTTRAHPDPARTPNIWCAGDWDPGRGTNFGICSARP